MQDNTSNTVKKNFVWSSILTITGYIFPLITFPYVTRVLGVEGIGNYQFADSVIMYFCTFSMLGMGTIGIREIAKVNGNRESMSRVFSNLLTLNLITTFISLFVLIVLIQTLPSYSSHSKLLYIGISRILCGSLLIEWLFKGLEEFRYITIRAVIVRCVYVALVFVFVRDNNDYDTYFLLTSLTVVVNAIINLVYSRKYVDFYITGINITPYIKPLITLGAYLVLTSMYTSFNVMYLGSKCDDIEVGYYSTATKLYVLIMSFFTAFTGVMLPRMSSILSSGNEREFKLMTTKSVDFLLLFCLPIIVLSEIYAPHIIRIIAGVGYDGAILPMRIVMPLMLVIGYEQIIIIQMLTPLKKDGAILINSLFGAGVGILLNILLIPKLASVGSAIVWCCSELSVLLSAQYFVTKYVDYHMPLKKIISSIISYIPALSVCIILERSVHNWILSFVIGTLFIGAYFIVLEYFIRKNELLVNNTNMIFKRLCGHKYQ